MINSKQIKYDHLFLDLAERVAQMSHATRLKVGALIEKNGNIISMGWNGMPAGMDNACEIQNEDGSLISRMEVLHAESNAIAKLAATGGLSADGGTLYSTDSPCQECAKLAKQSGIVRVVYRRQYRITTGLDMLRTLGIKVDQLSPAAECGRHPHA